MPIVGPQKETQVPVAYDTDNKGFGGPLDMNGPLVGVTAYSEPGNNLNLRLTVEFGQPNTKYQVFLTSGPSHALAAGFIAVGTLSTNAVGSGASTILVPHAVLLTAPFGPGYRTDHVDLLKGAGDLTGGVLTAGAINYFVCREKSEPTPGVELAAATIGASGKGDPCGEKH